MSEYVLFHRNIQGAFYTKLSFDTDEINPDAITGFDILSISVIETLRSGTPYLIVKFSDMAGDIFQDRPILPGSKFTFKFGRTPEESLECNFRFSEMRITPTDANTFDGVMIDATFVTDHWPGLFKDRVCRSWASKKISDVVESVAGDLQFDHIDIEPTFGISDHIQPYWTAHEFLVWLSRRAVNTNQMAGYQYGTTCDGGFFFKSYDAMYASQPKKEMRYTPDGSDREGFQTFSVSNDYLSNMLGGASGVKYSYFDYNKKKYVGATETVVTIPERQLSDWYYIDEGQLGPALHVDGGRDTKIAAYADNRVLTYANSIHTAEMLCYGDHNLHIGDVVKLLIPKISKHSPSSSVNEFYSGSWLLWKVAHMIEPKTNMFATKLYVSRNGISGIDLEGLIKTSTGKVLV